MNEIFNQNNLSDTKMDEFMDLFKGRDNFGTNTRYINRQITKIETKKLLDKKVPPEISDNILENLNLPDSDRSLAELYCEIGKDPQGNKKPIVCWDFVKNKRCCCHNMTNNSIDEGIIINNKWHPGKKEMEYLIKKMTK